MLAAAREAVEEDGIGALSMRRLAQRLDVWPMSIYTYFRDKDELLDALAGEAARAVELPAARKRWWRADLHALLGEVRAAVASDPSGRLPRAMLEHTRAAGEGLLARAGLDEDDAARVWRVLVSYAVGSALTADGSATTSSGSARGRRPPAAAAAADDEFARGIDRIVGRAE